MKYIVLLILVYLFIIGYLYFTQENKIFNNKFAKPYKVRHIKKLFFKTKNGIILEGGYVENKKNAPFVLYFSGNSNNVLEFLDNIAVKIKDYNFIGFNYPGYAGSEGKPCEECIKRYAIEIFDEYKPKFLMGRSLGSAVASYVAANRDIKGMVLITPIDSILNIAKHKYPFVPSWFIKHKFDAYKDLKKVNSLISLLLVKNEHILPRESIENVIKSINNLKEIKILDKVGHGNVYEYEGIDKILKKLLDGVRK